ncbi:unnamed protein product [Closterium sp. Naga37s-1]|nr:unnamed protein product [Closterium sp. Naga37s-1]
MGSASSKHRALEDWEDKDESSFPWLEPRGLKIGHATDVRRAYRLTRDVLGEGRTSIVWVGVDRSNGTHVAVKMLSKRIVTAMKGEEHRANVTPVLPASFPTPPHSLYSLLPHAGAAYRPTPPHSLSSLLPHAGAAYRPTRRLRLRSFLQ